MDESRRKERLKGVAWIPWRKRNHAPRETTRRVGHEINVGKSRLKREMGQKREEGTQGKTNLQDAVPSDSAFSRIK